MTGTGMHRHTGHPLTGVDHIRQSVADILTTPLGTRLARRDYGSLLPMLIDQPLNGATRLRAMSAAVTALVRWEPRIRIGAVNFEVCQDGALVLDIAAARADGPRHGAPGELRVTLREPRA